MYSRPVVQANDFFTAAFAGTPDPIHVISVQALPPDLVSQIASVAPLIALPAHSILPIEPTSGDSFQDAITAHPWIAGSLIVIAAAGVLRKKRAIGAGYRGLRFLKSMDRYRQYASNSPLDLAAMSGKLAVLVLSLSAITASCAHAPDSPNSINRTDTTADTALSLDWPSAPSWKHDSRAKPGESVLWTRDTRFAIEFSAGGGVTQPTPELLKEFGLSVPKSPVKAVIAPDKNVAAGR